MKDQLQFRIEFIKMVEQCPSLYDKSHPDYMNMKHRECLWANIGARFGVTDKYCRDKWKHIRANYIKATESNVTKGYYLESYLRFLLPFIKFNINPNFSYPNNSDELMDGLVIAEDDNPIEETDNKPMQPIAIEINTEQPTLPQPVQYPIEHPVEHVIVKRESEENAERNEKQRDPREMYLLSLMPHITTMTLRQQLQFQKGVVKLIASIKYRG